MDASLEIGLLIWKESNRWAMRWIRLLIVLIVIWPVTMVTASAFRAILTATDVMALAFLPILAIALWVFFFMTSPIVWIGIFAIPLARKALVILLIILGLEATIGTCLVVAQPTLGVMILFGILMSIGAMIAFWKFSMPRRWLFLLFFLLCTVWFIRIVEHADEITKKMQALVAEQQQQEQDKEVQKRKPSPGQPSDIPVPLAPARPNPSAMSSQPDPEPPPPPPEILYAKSSGGTMASSEKIASKGHCAADDGTSPTYTYGDYMVILQHCFVAGNQIMVTGLIQWKGDGSHNTSFHAFQISDPAGNTYEVQTGELGKKEGFGQGYFWQTLESDSPLAFSFTAGTVDPKSPPVALTLVFPNTQGDLGSGARFVGVTEVKD